MRLRAGVCAVERRGLPEGWLGTERSRQATNGGLAERSFWTSPFDRGPRRPAQRASGGRRRVRRADSWAGYTNSAAASTSSQAVARVAGHCDNWAMRFFNTAGPVRREDPYIPPLERIDLDAVLGLVRSGMYFVLRAPRQTGKTSALLALRDLLNGGSAGDYRCVYANFEVGKAAREDTASSSIARRSGRGKRRSSAARRRRKTRPLPSGGCDAGARTGGDRCSAE